MTPTEVRADFPADPASARQARRFIDVTLRTWGCDELLDTAVLLVSELVSNAVLHAGTTIRVVIRQGDAHLRLEVHDGGAGVPARKHHSAMSTTGRGLLLVEELADHWGVATAEDGKTVWFELDLHGADRADAGLAGYGAVDLGSPERFAPGPGPGRTGAGPGEPEGRPRLLVGAGPASP